MYLDAHGYKITDLCCVVSVFIVYLRNIHSDEKLIGTHILMSYVWLRNQMQTREYQNRNPLFRQEFVARRSEVETVQKQVAKE